jgi:hypothetical protein
MYRTRQASWFRPFAALMAVWLPLFVGEPNLLSPCPTHGAYAVSHAGAPSAHHHGHASMAGHGSKQSAPSHDEKDCSCIGCCAPGVARAAVADAGIVAIAIVAYGPAPSFPSVETHPRAAPDVSRPYPTGPPRA